MRFPDKVAVVTGGASGIGEATARALAREGARVAILDINAEGGERVAREIGGSAYACDVSLESQVRTACEDIAGRFGAIHILFANAGVSIRRPVGDEELAEWERVMSVNLRGVFLCAKYSLPHMQAGASIIATSSVTGVVGVRNRGVYTATKGALVAMARQMALDYAPRGIRVNAICPGFVRTPLIEAILVSDRERAGRIRSMHPLGRMGVPADIANAVLFLASEDASWITGVVLPVDGGFTAGHQQNV